MKEPILSAFNTNQVNEVLKAWANSYIEDVPAVHKEGRYFIEYETLVSHMNSLPYDTLVNVMLDAEESYVVSNP